MAACSMLLAVCGERCGGGGWKRLRGGGQALRTMMPHGMASEWMRCAKSLATLRSLLVSSRWIIVYCFANISSKHACGPTHETSSGEVLVWGCR
eukprot:scaffold459_cov117-Isochrysis_galbana.AAC.1